jgi:uncharacterized Zn finger protein
MAARKKSPNHALSSLLDLATIKSLAGSAYYERGRRYFESRAVGSLTEYRGTITAIVQGTTTYKVRFQADRGALSFSCTCPLGIDGDFCKHCVAAALAWLDAAKHGGVTTLDDLEGMVWGMSKDDLARIVLNHAVKNSEFRSHVLAAAARHAGGTALMPHYRKLVKDATEIGDDGYGEYLDYGGMPDYSESIRDLVATLDDLLTDKAQGPAVMELAMYAIERVEWAMEHSDDEAGYFDAMLGDLADLHLRACRIAKPDPIELATQLFKLEMEGEWDTFSGAYGRYNSVLGLRGREHYRALAEREWKKAKPLGSNSGPAYGLERYRVTLIMETIARTSGNLKELVDILRKDLSTAHQYLRIAEACHDAKQDDLALQWAEDGLQRFPTGTDQRLLDFLVDEYARRKMTAKMMAVAWQRFDELPSLMTYESLLKHVSGVKQKQIWRTKALDTLRARAHARKEGKRDEYGLGFSTARLLIEIHLSENHDADAWNTALELGCDNELWLRLAAARATHHPEDALAVYRSQVDERLPQAGGYELTVDLLKKIRPLMVRLGRADEFNAWIDELWVTWKRRRSFMALLGEAFGGTV